LYPVLLLAAAGSPAFADPLPDGYGPDPTKPLSYPLESLAPAPVGQRGYDLEFGVRVRRVVLPNGILDSWFTDQDDKNWAYIEPRPEISGTAVGMEFGLRARTASGTFYVEFVDSAMQAGYWDDVDDDPVDGNFLVPSNGLGLIGVGANSAYEVRLIRSEQTQGIYGLSLMLGGGLGLGVLVGGVQRWVEDDLGNPSYSRFLDGQPPDTRNGVSRLYPLLDLNVGLRSSFGEMVAWRIEGGLHTLPYVGSSLLLTF
jgi:hypothetical protein